MFLAITSLLKWSRKIDKCPYGINLIYQLSELKFKEVKWHIEDIKYMA